MPKDTPKPADNRLALDLLTFSKSTEHPEHVELTYHGIRGPVAVLVPKAQLIRWGMRKLRDEAFT
jgi:hypothetical protein